MVKMVWKSEEDLLEEAKENKKRELSSLCQDDILSGFNASIENKEYHFSYDREAQANLQERWQLFQNNMIDRITLTAHKGEETTRIEVDREVFDDIYLSSVKAKEDKIRKLRDDLFPLVDKAKSEKDLDNIKWEMEIIEPTPETVVVKNDELLNKEIKRVEMDSAVSASEMMSLIFMTQSGMFGDMSMMFNSMDIGGDTDV